MKILFFGVLPTLLYFGITISLSNLGHFAVADTLLYIAIGAIVLITVLVIFPNIPGGIEYRKRKKKLKELEDKIINLEDKLNNKNIDEK